MATSDYELQRLRKIQENQRAMQDFGILEAAAELAASSRKPQAPRRRSLGGRLSVDGALEVRRSDRVQKLPAVSYKFMDDREDDLLRHLRMGGRRSGGRRRYSTSSSCSDAARAAAFEAAEAIKVQGPSFVKGLSHSMIAGGFWLQWPVEWCVKIMPQSDTWVTLLDAEGVSWRTKYLGGKKGLSAGWRGYSIEKGLDDGDAIRFQLLDKEKWRMKVHIVRAERDGAAEAAVEVDEEELQIEEDKEEEAIPISADSEEGVTALVKEPSIDSPPKKRKREAKLSTIYKTVKSKPLGKKKKTATQSATKDERAGLEKYPVHVIKGRRVSTAGAVSFLCEIKVLKKDVWVGTEKVTSDSRYCWLSGEEEEK